MTGLPWTGRARLRTPAGAGTRLRIEFRYWTRPQRGIYFVRPDKAYPGVAPEIWSQGEPTDNRRWFPTWDEPNQKTPSELILTVPHGWTAIANGYLKAHTYTAATDIWDWNAPAPKSTYLIPVLQRVERTQSQEIVRETVEKRLIVDRKD